MNRRLITYNYLKAIANGSIHFHAFSYQYPGSGYEYRLKIAGFSAAILCGKDYYLRVLRSRKSFMYCGHRWTML